MFSSYWVAIPLAQQIFDKIVILNLTVFGGKFITILNTACSVVCNEFITGILLYTVFTYNVFFTVLNFQLINSVTDMSFGKIQKSNIT